MSMGPRYGWLVCCLVSGCYAEHDGLLECDGPEETTWPCDDPPARLAPAAAMCHLEDGTWLAINDGETPIHCAASEEGEAFGIAFPSCVEPGPTTRTTSVCPTSDSEVRLVRPARWPDDLEAPTYRVALGECAVFPRQEAEPYVVATDYSQLCDDPLARCGAPAVFNVHLAGYDNCLGAATIERCRLDVDGDRLVVTIDTARAVPWRGCERMLGARIATCVAPPLGAGTYTVLDTAGRVLGDLEVPLEQDAPREPRCTAIE